MFQRAFKVQATSQGCSARTLENGVDTLILTHNGRHRELFAHGHGRGDHPGGDWGSCGCATGGDDDWRRRGGYCCSRYGGDGAGGKNGSRTRADMFDCET